MMGMAGLAGGGAGLGAVGNITTGILAFVEGNKRAKEAREAAEREAELQRRKGRQLAGEQRAAFAAGGVKADTGTPLDILAQTAADAELNAIRAAFGFEQQAKGFKSQGRTALISGILGGGSTLLGGMGR